MAVWAGAAACRVTVVRVAVETVLAGTARAVLTLRNRVVVVEGAAAAEVSVVDTVVVGSATTGVASVTGGVGAGCAAAAGSVVDGGAAWADRGVEVNARAAAIAGRALVRA